MTLIAIRCPHCHREDVGKYGICNGKQRYICKNPECPHTTFYTEYTYNAYKPRVKAAVHSKPSMKAGGEPFPAVWVSVPILLSPN